MHGFSALSVIVNFKGHAVLAIISFGKLHAVINLNCGGTMHVPLIYSKLTKAKKKGKKLIRTTLYITLILITDYWFSQGLGNQRCEKISSPVRVEAPSLLLTTRGVPQRLSMMSFWRIVFSAQPPWSNLVVASLWMYVACFPGFGIRFGPWSWWGLG